MKISPSYGFDLRSQRNLDWRTILDDNLTAAIMWVRSFALSNLKCFADTDLVANWAPFKWKPHGHMWSSHLKRINLLRLARPDTFVVCPPELQIASILTKVLTFETIVVIIITMLIVPIIMKIIIQAPTVRMWRHMWREMLFLGILLLSPILQVCHIKILLKGKKVVRPPTESLPEISDNLSCG